MPAVFSNSWTWRLFDVDSDGDIDIENGTYIESLFDSDTNSLTFSSTIQAFTAVQDKICGVSNFIHSGADVDLDGDLDFLKGGWDQPSDILEVNESHFSFDVMLEDGTTETLKTKCLSSFNLGLRNKLSVAEKSLLHFESFSASSFTRAIIVVENELGRLDGIIANLEIKN